MVFVIITGTDARDRGAIRTDKRAERRGDWRVGVLPLYAER